ncbi:hypothetical protein TA3x_005421 [Tundrisphaera sp. TA3]|uniref:hypothetical protein n=1 Tax=Tundrisphaera sp. TA3 TaxID=3435775 RepID=UPI003EC0D71A
MTDLMVDPSRPAAPGLSRGWPGLIRWLYSQNPFYIISADLVFLGLRMSFDPNAKDFDTWALVAGLGGYTLLLAITGCLLIRFGKVWDDVRSILLLVVMMFLAISVTFDEILVARPRLGTICFAGGLLFSVVVSEAMLRGMRLGLPALFRIPYHLILALFFLYPVALVSFRDRPETPMAHWAVSGFSPLAGLCFLTLLPAIRRGPAYLRGNGSPWRWPMYPWSLFVFLGLGVCGRAYYLCTSMHGVDATRTIFGPFFLVPFGLAVAVLLLELGLVARHRGTIATAMALPMALAGLSLIGHRPDPIYRHFIALFEGQLGCDPAFATLVAATAFYAVAMARRVPLAGPGLIAALLGLSVVAPGTLGLDELVQPQAGPLVLIAATQAWMAIRDRAGWRWMVAAGCLIAAAFDLPAIRSLDRPGLVGFHLGLVAVLAIGAILEDRLGEILRRLGALLLLCAIISSAAGEPMTGHRPPSGTMPAYPLAMAAIALAYGYRCGGPIYYVPAAAGLGTALLMTGARGYLYWRSRVVGLDRIALGLASFLVAALISLRKAGLRIRPRSLAWLTDPGSGRPKPVPVDELGG